MFKTQNKAGEPQAPIIGFLATLLYASVPFLVLFLAIIIACFAAYFFTVGFDSSYPLHKTISRATQLLLVLSIFPAMYLLKINAEQLGFAKPRRFLKQILQGFALGFITLLPVFIILYALKINVPHTHIVWTSALLFKKLAIALGLALLISLLEEPLFRGLLITGVNKKLPVSFAVILSAFFYSTLHFLDSSTKIPKSELNIFSGFRLLGEALQNLANPGYFSAILALFAVGIFLGLLRTRFKNSLGLCIGCHTSWVWQIKMNKTFFGLNGHSHHLYLVSAYDGVIGHLVTAWLLLVLAGYFIYRYLKSQA